MSRAVWKGPFVEESLMKKVDKYKTDPKKIPIKTWSRKSTIIPDFVGVSFLIYNGKKFIPITISETHLILLIQLINCSTIVIFLSTSIYWFGFPYKRVPVVRHGNARISFFLIFLVI